MNLLILLAGLLVAVAAPPTDLSVSAPAGGSGLNLDLQWTPPKNGVAQAVLRSDAGPDGPWTVVKADLGVDKAAYTDTVTSDPAEEPPKDAYWYQVVSMREAAAPNADAAAVLRGGQPSAVVEGHTDAALFKVEPGIFLLLLLIASVGGMMAIFTQQARKGAELRIRRIPGIDAIEEGVGRATEMGKPVLYVPGIDSLEDIQTIASMLILGQVAKTIAEYQADVIVSCCVPIVREVADEVVRAGFYQAGHPDAFDPTSVRFISSEQFAFCAGTNGIMYRQKPATNIYLGRFFAESLILAETGYVNRSIQIAGTAEATQLPFFIAACDYTLIGEELFAVSAYLSRDPRLVSSLKASDWIKVASVILLALGVVSMSLGSDVIQSLFRITGG